MPPAPSARAGHCSPSLHHTSGRGSSSPSCAVTASWHPRRTATTLITNRAPPVHLLPSSSIAQLFHQQRNQWPFRLCSASQSRRHLARAGPLSTPRVLSYIHTTCASRTASSSRAPYRRLRAPIANIPHDPVARISRGDHALLSIASASGKMAGDFKLSAQLLGHEADVCPPPFLYS